MKNVLVFKASGSTKIDTSLEILVFSLERLARESGLSITVEYGDCVSPICIFSDDLTLDAAYALKKQALELVRVWECKEIR